MSCSLCRGATYVVSVAPPATVSRPRRPLRLVLVDARCPLPASRSAFRQRQQRAGGLQLTRAADYAVRALIHLALQPAGERLSQADIATAIEAPAPFVGKVMQQLASAGLVASQRGIGGGFALHPGAGNATMLDAVTAIEGPLALNACLSPDEVCSRSSFCPAHVVWHEAQDRVADVLRSASIVALARGMVVPVARTGAPVPAGDAGRPADDAGAAATPVERAARTPRAQDGQARARRRAGVDVAPRGRRGARVAPANGFDKE